MEKALSDIVASRPCGGSHTIICHPSKRRSKTTQFSQISGGEFVVYRVWLVKKAAQLPSEIPNDWN